MPTSKETKKRLKFIDEKESELTKRLRIIQVKLSDRVTSLFLHLRTKDGKIQNSATNYSLLSTLNRIGSEYRDQEKRTLIAGLIENMMAQEGLVRDYFKNVLRLEQPKVAKEVRENMLRRIGYDGKGFTKSGTLHDLWQDDTEIRNIKAQAIKAIAGGKSLKDFQQEIKNFITGTDENTGVTEAHFRTATMDIFNQNDRALTATYADKLKLDKFIFQGGLMKSTRPFCRARNNRVFTRKEIESWVHLDFEGKPTVYNPFLDVGGYNCRHVLDPISDELAAEIAAEEAASQPTPPAATAPAAAQQAPASKPAAKKASKKKGSDFTGNETLREMEDKIRDQKYESASLFTPEGKQLFVKDGSKSQVSFMSYESKQFKGNILTHNHPGSAQTGYANSFSYNDVKTFLNTGLKEIRAVTRTHEFSLSGTTDKPSSLIMARYNVLKTDYVDEATHRIREGKFTIADANKYVFHEIMKDISRKYGLTYSRKLIATGEDEE